MVKNPPANAGDAGDVGSIPGSGQSPGEGNVNPFQHSCLENPMDREVWWLQPMGLQRAGHSLVTEHIHTHILLHAIAQLLLLHQLLQYF